MICIASDRIPKSTVTQRIVVKRIATVLAAGMAAGMMLVQPVVALEPGSGAIIFEQDLVLPGIPVWADLAGPNDSANPVCVDNITGLLVDGGCEMQGPKGNAGAVGPTGPQGSKGDAGAAGPQGSKGDAGAAGPQGPRGNAGAVGPAGPQGPKGDQGDQGLQGDQGSQGLPGTTIPDGTAANDVLTWDGSNWIARQPPVSAMGRGNMQPYLAVNYVIALQGVYPSRNASDPLLGEIMLFGGNFAPRGWAFCDGQLLAISQNTALFSLLGTTYGGDGRTSFGLPDLRGRVAIHQGQGPGLSPRNLGQRGGTELIQ